MKQDRTLRVGGITAALGVGGLAGGLAALDMPMRHSLGGWLAFASWLRDLPYALPLGLASMSLFVALLIWRIELAWRNRMSILLVLRGVGQWTVDMASMFYFQDTDIWPEGDLAVSRTFRTYLTANQARNMHDIVARFVPNRSYLALYMWKVLDGVP